MNERVYNNVKIEDLNQISRDVLDIVHSKNFEENKSVVIYLNGVMGAGKTTFAKAFAAELGVTEDVQSPTFTIMREYQIDKSSNNTEEININIENKEDAKDKNENSIKNNFDTLLHIDAYRFEDKKEGDILNLKSRIGHNKNDQEKNKETQRNIILIEWAENMYAPNADIEINIEKIKNQNGDNLEEERNIFVKINSQHKN